MRDFFKVLLRFVPPYKKYLVMTIFFNILSAVLNVFSFTLIIPILQILFKMEDGTVYQYLTFEQAESAKDWAVNNFYYGVNRLIEMVGPSTTLLILGVFLSFMTALKTGAYFLSSATIIPIRTGVVRDIRNQLFNKILALPLGFFSDERKGDIIARMSGDVQEVENSIMSSLDMLFKNPILIVAYFGTLIAVSWQLTLFTLIVLPGMGWFMGKVGRTLKRTSLTAQNLWGATMSQVEETLGGLRVIKAFHAEQKMYNRFASTNESYRNTINWVNIRQQLAHPMSEFLGTILIVIVLWFGGWLILDSDNSFITAPTFIFYLVMLYSLINPLKEFSRATYNVPKGMASMERIDKILQAVNNIPESAEPKRLDMKANGPLISFQDVSFRYDQKYVLQHINLDVEDGKTIAIVGQSGSGKTTLVDLIPRFYDVKEGRILLAGTDIRDVAFVDLRDQMGIVNQEAILFNDTFYNNITFGVKQATREEVIEA
ncbi:MAG: ABC transporter ATP-binding protein, partial [Bacteroidaceae bacterium]|nr:ABC transporter ATP-binding protein [Bacteroidaceae bacterium]